jgi:hypothetical protein
MAQQQPAIRLKVLENVELESGVVIPPGIYSGNTAQFSFDDLGRGVVDSLEREHKLKLTADQIVSMAGKTSPNLLSCEYDVTKFVRSGQILVR